MVLMPRIGEIQTELLRLSRGDRSDCRPCSLPEHSWVAVFEKAGGFDLAQRIHQSFPKPEPMGHLRPLVYLDEDPGLLGDLRGVHLAANAVTVGAVVNWEGSRHRREGMGRCGNPGVFGGAPRSPGPSDVRR